MHARCTHNERQSIRHLGSKRRAIVWMLKNPSFCSVIRDSNMTQQKKRATTRNPCHICNAPPQDRASAARGIGVPMVLAMTLKNLASAHFGAAISRNADPSLL